jgi:hypothetical protein
MLELANSAAVEALWVSHNSVSALVMRLFSAIQPRVVDAIQTAQSKIHISFDGWMTEGGRRGYFVLDNASNNDTTVAALARHVNFTTAHRRLRCGPHTLNLIA